MAVETVLEWLQKQWNVVLVNEEGAGCKIGVLRPTPGNSNNRVWYAGAKVVDAFKQASEAERG